MKKETVFLSVVAVVLVFFAGAFFSTSLVTGNEISSKALTSDENPDLYSCRRLYDATTTGDAACASLPGSYSCVEDVSNMPTARVMVDGGYADLQRSCSFNWSTYNMCSGTNDAGECLLEPPTVLCCR